MIALTLGDVVSSGVFAAGFLAGIAFMAAALALIVWMNPEKAK